MRIDIHTHIYIQISTLGSLQQYSGSSGGTRKVHMGNDRCDSAAHSQPHTAHNGQNSKRESERIPSPHADEQQRDKQAAVTGAPRYQPHHVGPLPKKITGSGGEGPCCVHLGQLLPFLPTLPEPAQLYTPNKHHLQQCPHTALKH